MSVARGFGLNGKSIYMNVAKPEVVWCNFIVDHSNGNGLGIRSLKSNGYIQSVFMNTSATPGVVAGVTNPNPIAGYAVVTFTNNFNFYLGGGFGQIPLFTGSALTSVTQNHVYVINTVGTTTLAQWQTKGLPPGLTPAFGQTFVATATGALGGSGTVKVPGVPLVYGVAGIGDPNSMIANSNIAANGGAQQVIQFVAPTDSATTTLLPTAPPDNTVIGLDFWFDASTVTIDGL